MRKQVCTDCLAGPAWLMAVYCYHPGLWLLQARWGKKCWLILAKSRESKSVTFCYLNHLFCS